MNSNAEWRGFIAGCLFLLALAHPAAAQAYPDHPVRLIVPFAAGGGVDVVARLVAPAFSDALGQSIVIENKGGAGGALGATEVAQASPDGYTLLLGTGSTHGTNSSVYTHLPYDPVRDFAPVALLVSHPLVLLSDPALPVHSATDLIALMRSKPGELNFGSYGTGSINHLAAELFDTAAGVRANHVPYRGSAPMLTDLIAGRIQFAFDGVATSAPYVRAGSLRLLGVASAKRASVYPEEPTIAEQALPGFDAGVWFGIFAPAGTPQPIIDLLNRKADAALKTASTRESFAKLGMDVEGGAPGILAEQVRDEIHKWAAIVRDRNIHIDP